MNRRFAFFILAFSTLLFFIGIQALQPTVYVTHFLATVLFFAQGWAPATWRNQHGKPETESKLEFMKFPLHQFSKTMLFGAMLYFFARLTTRLSEQALSEIANSLFIQIPLFISFLIVEIEIFFMTGNSKKDAEPPPPHYPPLSSD